MNFDEWWKQTKPAECDELKPYFEEAWEISATTEREACAEVAGFAERWIGDWIARYGNRSVSDAIRERPNVEVTGASGAFAAKRPCGPQG